MSRRTTFTVGCSMEPDQYLPFLAGSVIEAVGTHASVAGLERLREARAKLDRLISTLEQLEREQKEAQDRDLRNIQAQQQHDLTGDPAADCVRLMEFWARSLPNLTAKLQALSKKQAGCHE